MYVADVQRGRRLGLVGCVVLAVLAAACSGDDPPPDHTDLHPEETAILPTAPPSTAPPTTSAIGEQVTTVEAAQRLLDLFARLDGDAARMLMQKGAPDAEFDQALQAVYVGQELGTAQKRFTLEADQKFRGYARPQPDIIFRAREIVDARQGDCVIVSGTADLRPRYTNPVPTVEGIFLMVVEAGITPKGENPTRWRLRGIGTPEANTDLLAICPAL